MEFTKSPFLEIWFPLKVKLEPNNFPLPSNSVLLLLTRISKLKSEYLHY